MIQAALLVALAAWPVQGPPDDDPGGAVRALLSAKCVSCHHPGSDSRKARREFDGMQELDRVRDEIVQPGDLELSDLWLAVESGDMPPEDSEVAALDDAELGLLRDWILAGAPLPADGDVAVPLPVVAEEAAEQKSAPQGESDDGAQDEKPVLSPFIERLELFAARLHPASTHFPIGLLLAAVLARILGWAGTRPRLRAAEGYCLLLGALGAAAACGLGWLAADHGSFDEQTVFWHRWLAIGTAGASWLLVLTRPFAAATRSYGWLLLLTGAALTVAGHFGGELAWGADGPRLGILFPQLAE